MGVHEEDHGFGLDRRLLINYFILRSVSRGYRGEGELSSRAYKLYVNDSASFRYSYLL